MSEGCGCTQAGSGGCAVTGRAVWVVLVVLVYVSSIASGEQQLDLGDLALYEELQDGLDPSRVAVPGAPGAEGRRPGILGPQVPGGPPKRPKHFKSVHELHSYLEALRDYYAVLGRPRFGRSVPLGGAKAAISNNDQQLTAVDRSNSHLARLLKSSANIRKR